MKKLLIGILLMSLVLLSMISCTQPTQAVVQTSVITETKTLPATTVVNTVTVIKVVDPISGNEYTIKQGETGVANADANVNGYFNGLNASWIGLELNGDDVEHQFNVTVTPYSNDSVAPAPSEIADWVTITNPNLVNGLLTVSPMSAASLYTTLNVPSGILLPEDWGFTVNVSRADQGNYVVAEAIRWIVHMRQP
jgi:hypothetical protein